MVADKLSEHSTHVSLSTYACLCVVKPVPSGAAHVLCSMTAIILGHHRMLMSSLCMKRERCQILRTLLCINKSPVLFVHFLITFGTSACAQDMSNQPKHKEGKVTGDCCRPALSELAATDRSF